MGRKVSPLTVETLDLLQEVIADYEGTVLIVSHDRDFLDRTVTVTLGLDGSGKVDVGRGPASTRSSGRSAPRSSASARCCSTRWTPTAPAPARTKLSYKDQRDYELLPAQIELLDREIAESETLLADAGQIEEAKEYIDAAEAGKIYPEEKKLLDEAKSKLAAASATP